MSHLLFFNDTLTDSRLSWCGPCGTHWSVFCKSATQIREFLLLCCTVSKQFLRECSLPPQQLLRRNPNDLGSPDEVDLWSRYVVADALARVLEAGSKADKLGKASVGAGPPRGHADVATPTPGSESLGCPFTGGVGSDAASSRATQGGVHSRGLSLELYAAMDVDERTAVVHKHLPPVLLHYLETAFQVRGYCNVGDAIRKQ